MLLQNGPAIAKIGSYTPPKPNEPAKRKKNYPSSPALQYRP